MSDKHAINIGTVVKVRKGVSITPGPKKFAVVRAFLPDVEGGVVLDRRLEGFYCWNVMHLQAATRNRTSHI